MHPILDLFHKCLLLMKKLSVDLMVDNRTCHNHNQDKTCNMVVLDHKLLLLDMYHKEQLVWELVLV